MAYNTSNANQNTVVEEKNNFWVQSNVLTKLKFIYRRFSEMIKVIFGENCKRMDR